MKKDYSFKKIKEVVFSRSRQNKERKLYNKVLRWLSIPFTKLFLYTPISANQMTLIAVLLTMGSAIPFAFGGLKYGLIGVLLLYLGELGDYVDGPIARCKGQTSRLPCHFLTHFYHQGALSLIFIGLGLGVFRFTGNLIFVYAGFLGGFFHLFTVYVFELRMALLLEYEYRKFKKVHDGSKIFIKNKLQRLGLQIFVFPVAHVRSIILICFLFGVVDWLVLFYGVFLSLRAILFFARSYFGLKRLDKKE